MKLIGLYSPYPQSGKGTFADGLASLTKTSIVKFADAMRDVIVPFVGPFMAGGEDEVRAWLNDERKDNKTIPGVGVTLRYMLQELGTGWGRERIHPDLWVLILRERLRQLRGPWGPNLAVVDDLRMENEYAMLRKEGAVLVKITRPDSPPTRPHPSNAALEGLAFDYIIENNGTMDALRRKAVAVAWKEGVA